MGKYIRNDLAIAYILWLFTNKERNFLSKATISGGSDINSAINFLRINKISLEYLNDFLYLMNIDVINNTVNTVDKYSKIHKYLYHKWIRTLEFITNILNKNKINYVVIKYLRGVKSIMSDIDLAPLDVETGLKIVNILKKEGLKEQNTQPIFSNPLKINLYMKNVPFPIELYNDCIWRRRKVCESRDIVLQRYIEKHQQINIPVPRPEHDMLILIFHEHHDLEIKLAGLMHILYLFSQKRINTQFLLESASKKLLYLPLCFYLKVLIEFVTVLSNYFLFDFSNEKETIEYIYDSLLEKYPICRSINDFSDSNISKNIKNFDFPIKPPFFISRIIEPLFFLTYNDTQNYFEVKNLKDHIFGTLSYYRYFPYEIANYLKDRVY